MTSRSQAQPDRQQEQVPGFLGWMERVGNRLPDPFLLFVYLLVALMAVSAVLAAFGVQVTVPGEDEPLPVRSALSGEGLQFFLENFVDNFIGFPPLGNVLVILLGVGLAERVGLLRAVIQLVFSGAPARLLPYAVALVGVSANIASDASFVVVPPLAALVFRAAGRHPVAGLICGFASVGAGYSAALLITSVDALLSGITTEAAGIVPAGEGITVTAADNYFFNVVSALILPLVAGFVTERVVEPRLGPYRAPAPAAATSAAAPATTAGNPTPDPAESADPVDRPEPVSAADARREEAVAEEHRPGEVQPTGEPTSEARPEGTAPGERGELDATARRGLRWAGLTALAYAAVVVLGTLPSGSPFRGDGGALVPSPLLSGIVLLVFGSFFLPGLAYGIATGAITAGRDVPRLMTEAVRDLAGYIVLIFAIGQFIALFGWTNIGALIAVRGADLLQSIGLTGFAAIVGFVMLASVLNLFLVSASAMWSLLAPVFIPLFLLLGYEPGFVQAAFRIGDSATQIITPMNPYLLVLLGFVRRYEPDAGLGTLMARLFPYVIPFWVVWVLILAAFVVLGIPVGPGTGMRL